MKFIFEILKGTVMGIANIIPGVSGGTMAVSMGIYDKMIHAVTHLFKEFKKSFMILLPIGIGMLLGIVGLSFVIKWMFRVIPIQTNLLFIGLILGGLPAVWKRVKGVAIRPQHIIGLLVFFALVVFLAAIDGTEDAAADMSFSVINCFKLLGVGIVAAATMVIPGVSGSMMLMLMGYYNPVVSSVSDFAKAVFSFDIAGIMNGLGILVPFGIGVVIGIFAIAKLIEILLVKCPHVVFWSIIGLILASPIAIVLLNDFSGLNVFHAITAAIALVIGFIIALFLGGDGKDSKKKAA